MLSAPLFLFGPPLGLRGIAFCLTWIWRKRNPILVTGVAFCSSSEWGSSTAMGDGVNGPRLLPALLSCQTQLSYSSRSHWAMPEFPSGVLTRTASLSATCIYLSSSKQLSLQLSPATRRGFVWVGQGYMCCREAFPQPFLELHGSSKRVMCFTGHSMAASF